MKNVAIQVMTTVNAPYGADLSAHQLAAMVADPKSAESFSAPVLRFSPKCLLPYRSSF